MFFRLYLMSFSFRRTVIYPQSEDTSIVPHHISRDLNRLCCAAHSHGIFQLALDGSTSSLAPSSARHIPR